MTDEWAAEASEFETVDELQSRHHQAAPPDAMVQAQMALQQKAVDALVELVTEEIPPSWSDELRERIHDLNHRLEQPGHQLGQFLGATGRTNRSS